MTHGMADFTDRRFADDFSTRISPIDFEVRELSTLPDETGDHQLQLRTEIGARLQWQGTLGLNPLVASGEVTLSDLVFERIWPYLEPRLAMAPPKGTGRVGFTYRLGYEGGGLSMVLEDIAATIEGLAIAGAEAVEPGIGIGTITLTGGRFDLREQRASAEALDVTGGRIAARRDADGQVDIASWFASPDGERGIDEGEGGRETERNDEGDGERTPGNRAGTPSNEVSGTITPG